MRPLLGVPFKYSIKFLSSNIVSVRRPDVSYFGHLRNKSDKCCKDVSQTEGKKVEVWPRPEGTLKGYKMNRSSTPEDQPPNYDPYRIKMPNVVVPPLPPSNAKEIPSEEVSKDFDTREISPPKQKQKDMFVNSKFCHPDYWKNSSTLPKIAKAPRQSSKLGYHGKTKFMYAFHEPWKPLDRIALLAKAEKAEKDASLSDFSAVVENKVADTDLKP